MEKKGIIHVAYVQIDFLFEGLVGKRLDASHVRVEHFENQLNSFLFLMSTYLR